MGTVARNGNGCLQDAEKHFPPKTRKDLGQKMQSTFFNSTTLREKCESPIPWIGEIAEKRRKDDYSNNRPARRKANRARHSQLRRKER